MACCCADYVRELANLCDQRRSPPAPPAHTLRSLAQMLDARNDDDVTDPNVTIMVCPHCGLARPTSWTPPAG